MAPEIKTFLEKEVVGALTVSLPDGDLHSAAMHFSYSENPFLLYFSTDKTSRKGGGLTDSTSKASFVLGLSEEEWKTFQVSGDMRIATAEEVPAIKEIHYAKNPGSRRFESDPNTVFLVFEPTWWRYSDFNQKPPLMIEGNK